MRVSNNVFPVQASLRYGDFMTQLSDVPAILSEWAQSIWFAPAKYVIYLDILRYTSIT
jgi:hypothetical protein